MNAIGCSASFARFFLDVARAHRIIEASVRRVRVRMAFNPFIFVPLDSLRIALLCRSVTFPPGFLSFRVLKTPSVIFPIIAQAPLAIRPSIGFRAFLAFTKMTIRHSGMMVERTKRFRLAAFEAGFHS